MIPLKNAAQSSIGKKVLMAITGLGFFGFLVTHLTANLTLLSDNPDTFNGYAHGLAELGPLLWVAEIGLFGLLLGHAALGIQLTLQKQKTKGSDYEESYRSKKGPSYASISTRSMIITGGLLLTFVVLHVLHLKFAVMGGAEYTTTMADGTKVRDLYRLVVEEFQNPAMVIAYVGVMGMLGLHLRHGIWSGFQSLGALNPRLEKPIYFVGVASSVAMAVGFLGIPIYIFFAH